MRTIIVLSFLLTGCALKKQAPVELPLEPGAYKVNKIEDCLSGSTMEPIEGGASWSWCLKSK